MPGSKRDPLSETWPEDPGGTPITERQAEYLLGEFDRLRAQIPTPEEREYLNRKTEEDQRLRAVKSYLREHWPRAALVLTITAGLIGGLLKGLAWLAAYNVTITHK